MTQTPSSEKSSTTETPTNSPLLFLARVLDAVLLLIVTPFLVFEGLPDPSRLSRVEFVQLFNFLAAYAGLVLAWRRELIGGSLAVIAIAGFCITERLATGRFPESPIFIGMGAAGALFMIAKLARPRLSPSRTDEPTERAGLGRSLSKEQRNVPWSTTFSS